MKNSIKQGFGLAIGYTLAMTLLHVVSESFMKKAAKDEKYMEGLKDRDPEFYEKLKKYQSN